MDENTLLVLLRFDLTRAGARPDDDYLLTLIRAAKKHLTRAGITLPGADHSGVDIDDFYWMTFAEFKAGNDTIENLTGAFELCYEKPADWAAASSYQNRVDDAQYWLTWLQGQGFGTAHLIMKRKRNRLRKKPLIT